MRHPEMPYVLINAQTAKERGIGELDEIKICSKFGEAPAVAHLTEGIHPEVVAMTNMGHWCRHVYGPRARGVNHNRFLSSGLDYTDMASGVFETAAKVRVTKA